jgi:putative spermidine/putrescine transport system permease protein
MMRSGFQKKSWHIFLLTPLVAYLLVFFVYPISGMLIQSFFDPSFTLKHYHAMIKYPVYLKVFLNTLEISLGVSILCVLIGYPIAYYLSESKTKWALILLISILIPFWISVLVRTYSWMIILGRYGVANDILRGVGFIDEPLKLMHNRLGVYIGMVYVLLPFTVFPMMSVMEGIDRTLLKAADSAGSTPWQTFRHIFLPLSLPGVGAGFLLTFIISAGYLVTPALMGGSKDTMIAMSIHEQLELVSNWGFAAALGVILLITVLILFFVYNHFLGVEILLGQRPERRRKANRGGIGGFVSKIRNVLANENMASAMDRWVWGISDFFSHSRQKLIRVIPGVLLKARWRAICVTSICMLVFMFMMIPVVLLVPMAFSNDYILHFPPETYGLGLIKAYFSSQSWMLSTFNSFQIAILVMVLSTTMGTLAALSLVRGKYRGKQLLYAFFLSPIIIPFIITALSDYFFFAKFKLIGTITALVLAHTVIAIPYVVIVMTSVLKGFDENLEQASMSLGAGRLRTFFKITFPIIRPGILTALLFSFISSFDELIIAMFICGVDAVTLPKQMWDGIRDEINPILSAVAFLLILLTILLMVIANVIRGRGRRVST